MILGVRVNIWMSVIVGLIALVILVIGLRRTPAASLPESAWLAPEPFDDGESNVVAEDADDEGPAEEHDPADEELDVDPSTADATDTDPTT